MAGRDFAYLREITVEQVYNACVELMTNHYEILNNH
jgi:hypothetical protein